MRLVVVLVLPVLAAGLALSCGESADDSPPPAAASAGTGAGLDAAAAGIRAAAIARDIEILASDDMGGRGPGTMGAARARDHLIARLEAAGAEPFDGESWTQDLPLRSVVSRDQELTFRAADETWTPRFGPDHVLVSRRDAGPHAVSGEVVFCGHGADAPAWDWNDFEGADLAGKVLVMLVGDPPVEDDAVFGGRAMTYYGRWTYKYEKARELGAAGCIVVHRTDWAGYPWAVVLNSWSAPRMDLRGGDPAAELGFEAWMSWEAAARLCALGGQDLEKLALAATRRDFAPVPLGVTADAKLTNATQDVDDLNVAGAMRGSDPERAGEWIVYTAHYDHLGTIPAPDGGDGIHNGAIDNASGCAGVLAIAEAWGRLDPRPARSALFLFVGSEEKGLLGSRWYADHPLVAPEKTVAAINIDGLNVHEETRDLEVIGFGQNDLEERLARVLAREDRVVVPDSEPEKGSYYRSDHFHFARIGIPALYTKSGTEVEGEPKDRLKKAKEIWTRESYHRPSDEFDPTWPLTDGAADARALFRLGAELATSTDWPQWSASSEFSRGPRGPR